MVTTAQDWVSPGIVAPELSPAEHFWLLEVQHLSHTLQACFSNWHLAVHHHGALKPAADERSLLKLAAQEAPPCFGRIVMHYQADTPLVIGRVIMLMDTYYAYQDILDTIGTAPIGEYFLFREPAISRSDFKVKRVAAQTPGTATADQSAALAGIEADGTMWARASVFTSKQHRILICEYFLPSFPYPAYAI